VFKLEENCLESCRNCELILRLEVDLREVKRIELIAIRVCAPLTTPTTTSPL
jgi:hypothetical protein